jgi:hypothetical protein
MTNKLRRFLGLGFAIGTLAMTLTMARPARAMAGPVYSAGTWNAPICSCPVLVGGCVCQIN